MDHKNFQKLAVMGVAALVFALVAWGVRLIPGLQNEGQLIPVYCAVGVLLWGLPSSRRGWWVAGLLPVVILLECADIKRPPPQDPAVAARNREFMRELLK